MRRLLLALLMCLVGGVGTSQVWADAPQSPLELVPQGQEFVLHLSQPKQIFDFVYNHELFPEWRKIQVVQDYYDGTSARRFFQLLSYFEKELGQDRLELLDQLTGGGAVLTGRATEPSTFLAIVKAKDADLLKRFVALSRKVLEQELSRQEGKPSLKLRKHQGVEILQLDKFNLAVRGEFMIAASDRKLLEQALDLCLGGKGDRLIENPRFKEASKDKTSGSLAWGWIDWEEVKKISQVKSGIEQIGGDPLTFLVVGGIADVVKRTPWIGAELTREQQNLRFVLRMPRGREGMPPIMSALVPASQKCSLPLLKPSQAISSTSFYLDFAHFWDHRDKFLNQEDLKEIEKGEKFIAPFLGGKTLGELFKKLGPYYRFIATQPSEPSKTNGKLSAFGNSVALVVDLRDPSFGANISKILRGAALAGTVTLGMKMKEEEYHGHKLVSYSFNPKTKVNDDPENIRLTLSPCFAQVGNQFMVSSTLPLGKELIDLLDKENRSVFHGASTHMQHYAPGLANGLQSVEETLTAYMILSQGLTLSAARQECKNLINLVRRLGQAETTLHYGPNSFRLEAIWQFKN